MRLDLATGAAITIGPVPSSIGVTATWSPDGSVLFSSIEGPAIYRVPIAGGAPVAEVKVDQQNEVRVAFPSFLPDGRRYLYLVKYRDGTNTLMLANPGKPAQRRTCALRRTGSITASSPTSRAALRCMSPGSAKMPRRWSPPAAGRSHAGMPTAASCITWRKTGG